MNTFLPTNLVKLTFSEKRTVEQLSLLDCSDIPKYIYIIAWNNYIGISDLKLSSDLKLAETTNAPHDAVFYNDSTHTWTTAPDITNYTTIKGLVREIARILSTK